MTDPFDDTHDSRPDPSEKIKNPSLKSEAESLSDDFDAVGIADEDELLLGSSSKTERVPPPSTDAMPKEKATLPSGIGYPVPPLAMVETAFLASTSSLIWLINYYFPLGPLLRMFFPIPIALVYLRWGNRASWMAALVSGLLLSVLMGPTRSVLFVIPFGLMGVQLGAMWRRGTSWLFSISTGTLLGTLGFFFRFWLLSILLGEDLWVYVMSQITEVEIG